MTMRGIIPIFVLLISLLILKLPADKAGALSLITASLLAFFVFGIPFSGFIIAISKGFSMSLYVLLIVWAAMYLYHLVDEAGAIKVIQTYITEFISNRFFQFLLLSWIFASLLQGIAGFGVPVVIVTPILIGLGFDPFVSTAAVLIGHSWSVSFGSMGSSFFTIHLVSGLPQSTLGPAMAIFDFVAMITTGISVCFLYGKWDAVKKGFLYVLTVSAFMTAIVLGTIKVEMYSTVGLFAAIGGFLALFALYYIIHGKREPKKNPDRANEKLTFIQALSPYAVVLVFSVLFQLLPLSKFKLGFSYPAFATALGYAVKEESSFSPIKVFIHPAFIIFIAASIAILLYTRLGVLDKAALTKVRDKTVTKCIPTTISLGYLICTALVMMDSGMTHYLAEGVAKATGTLYPILSPFFGVLGSFITGSNTNSNVIFGSLQYGAAEALNVSKNLMCAIQSIGGSVGVAIGPTTVLMGASAAKLTGKESEIYKKVLLPVLFSATMLGILNYILLILMNLEIGG